MGEMKRILGIFGASIVAVAWNGFWMATVAHCLCQDSWIVDTRFRDIGTTSMLFLTAGIIWAIAKKETKWLVGLLVALLLANPFVAAFITNSLLIPNGADVHVSVRWDIKTLF